MAPIKKIQQPLGPHFLQQWRKHRRMNQEEASAQIGYDKGLISKLENSKTPYTQYTLEALARVYDTTPGALLSINPLEPTTAQIDRILDGILVDDAPSIHKLLKRIRGISDANIESFVPIIVNVIKANAASQPQSQSDGLSGPSRDHRESESSQ